MLVTHRLRGLVQFAGFSDFVAIVDCLDPKGSTFLRRLENPEHNNFEPDRLREPKEVRKARDELKRLADFVRSSLKKHARIERGEVTELDELSEFFQDPDEEEPIAREEGGETDLDGSMTLHAKAPRSHTHVVAVTEGEEGETGGGDENGDGGDGRGSRCRDTYASPKRTSGGCGGGPGSRVLDGATRFAA